MSQQRLTAAVNLKPVSIKLQHVYENLQSVAKVFAHIQVYANIFRYVMHTLRHAIPLADYFLPPAVIEAKLGLSRATI